MLMIKSQREECIHKLVRAFARMSFHLCVEKSLMHNITEGHPTKQRRVMCEINKILLQLQNPLAKPTNTCHQR